MEIFWLPFMEIIPAMTDDTKSNALLLVAGNAVHASGLRILRIETPSTSGHQLESSW